MNRLFALRWPTPQNSLDAPGSHGQERGRPLQTLWFAANQSARNAAAVRKWLWRRRAQRVVTRSRLRRDFQSTRAETSAFRPPSEERHLSLHGRWPVSSRHL